MAQGSHRPDAAIGSNLSRRCFGSSQHVLDLASIRDGVTADHSESACRAIRKWAQDMANDSARARLPASICLETQVIQMENCPAW